jgi:hypothetical protein
MKIVFHQLIRVPTDSPLTISRPADDAFAQPVRTVAFKALLTQSTLLEQPLSTEHDCSEFHCNGTDYTLPDHAGRAADPDRQKSPKCPTESGLGASVMVRAIAG